MKRDSIRVLPRNEIDYKNVLKMADLNKIQFYTHNPIVGLLNSAKYVLTLFTKKTLQSITLDS